MAITFFVRSIKGKKKDATIRIRFRNGRDIDLNAATPLTVQLEYWNQKAKKNEDKIRDMVAFIERDKYKKIISKLETHIKTSFLELKSEPTSEWLRTTINDYFRPEPEERPVTLLEFIKNYIETSKDRINPNTGKKITSSTLKKYNTCYHYLQDYCKETRKTIDFANIDIKFYEDFIEYLNSKKVSKGKDRDGNKIIEKGLAVNTVGKQIAVLKGFLNEATEQKINTYTGYKSKKFTVLTEDADAVYLNDAELKKLFDYDFSGSQRLDRIRDLFLVGCWTGCRYSDFSAISPEQVKNDFLYVQQEKTGAKVVIPLHPVVKSILEKYKGILPVAPSNQKFNEYIKEVCGLAGINETTSKTVTRGGETVTRTVEKWEIVSSHTARRSFATNLYKSGFPAISIMKITGHKTERAFLKYIKVTPEEHAKLLAEHWKKINTI